jgi:hypothetical protein
MSLATHAKGRAFAPQRFDVLASNGDGDGDGDWRYAVVDGKVKHSL